MERYLESLPSGLRSFPDYLQKATVLQQFAEDMGGVDFVRKIPASLHAALASESLRSYGWIPEVVSNAVLLALRDLAFDSDEKFVESGLKSNHKLFQNPLYRTLMKAFSPSFMVRNGGIRWRVFHRGIQIQVVGDSPNSAVVRLSFANGLVPELITRALYATAFQAAIEVAGGESVSSLLVKHDLISSEFVVRWS